MATPVGPYTPAVRAGDLLFVSGQIGIDESGTLVEGGFEAQVRKAIANLVGVLGDNGLTLANVVKAGVFLVDVDTFAPMNDIYIELMGAHRPARSTVAVAALPKGALFEIEAIAHVG